MRKSRHRFNISLPWGATKAPAEMPVLFFIFNILCYIGFDYQLLIEN